MLAAITCHGFDPRSIAEARWPFTNFGDYLHFMEACREKLPTGSIHIHHVLPEAQFPEFADVPENKIPLSDEDHARAHELLNQLDIPELYVAPALVLSASDAASLGGLAAAAVHKKNGTGYFSREHQRRAGLANKRKKHGYCGLTLEERQAAGRIGGPIANHNRWHVKRGIVSPTCSLCAVTGQRRG